MRGFMDNAPMFWYLVYIILGLVFWLLLDLE
jgi:hypothetical protein